MAVFLIYVSPCLWYILYLSPRFINQYIPKPMGTTKQNFLSCACLSLAVLPLRAQTFTWITSTQDATWQTTKAVKLTKGTATADVTVDNDAQMPAFRAWGVTFNELDWDALGVLTRNEQDEILEKVFAPDGELRATRGRISMGANDYARSWYSCDEEVGDLELRYFNIDRDRQTIIPFVRAAQKYCPNLTCWISPWCPPSWMKINGNYAVLSSKYNTLPERMNYLLYGKTGGKVDEDEMKLTGERKGKFPRQLATTDYFIQDPRYLQAYAEYFCRFIDAYKQEGITIDMVMYQNEAYSYTPYPGCAWTAEGTIRFNRDYLAPQLKQRHPEVKLYLGTFNTNRLDYVQKIVADKDLQACVEGMGLQWEAREILPDMRKEHPQWHYVCSESECGWGSFDWPAAEHTFELLNHYLGNGCDEYNFWNMILTDNGVSPWGWKQNALIRVDSRQRTFTYTPEYYAARHYCSFVAAGDKVVAHKAQGDDKKPVIVFRSASGKYVVIAGNFKDEAQQLNVSIEGKLLNATLPAHSFNTFRMK